MKILVSTIDPFTQNGKNTLEEYLATYLIDEKIEVTNLHIKTTRFHSKNIDYFQISENEVIKSLYSNKVKPGVFYHKDNIKIDSESYVKENRRYSFFSRYRFWIFLLARELIWKLSKWKNKNLKELLKNHYTHFLFPYESNIFFNRINLYVLKVLKIRPIVFLWDDVITYRKSTNPLFLIHRYFLRKGIKNLIKYTDKFVVNNQYLGDILNNVFLIKSTLINRSVVTKPLVRNLILVKPHSKFRIIYAGNLFAGRFSTLIDFLGVINDQYPDRFIIDLYTNPYYKNLIDKCKKFKFVNLNDFVHFDQLYKKLNNSDLLLFLDNLRNNDYSTSLSFSTKITDYLSVPKLILAIGSKHQSSIRFLEKNNVAFVMYNLKKIKLFLNDYVNGKISYMNYRDNILSTINIYFNLKTNQDKFKGLINEKSTLGN